MATLRHRRIASVHTMKISQSLPTTSQTSCVARLSRLMCQPIGDWSGVSSGFQQSGIAAVWSLGLSRRRRGTLDSESLGYTFRLNPKKTSRTMSRWIQHPALIWTLLMLFGLPNLLGQGFHVALHHSQASHDHGSASAESTTTCSHSHSPAKTESTAAKKRTCCHHRHSHADASSQGEQGTSVTRLNSLALAVSDATLGHDPHNCSVCQYYSTAQALTNPVECAISQRACGKLGVLGQAASCLRAASVSGRLVSRLSMTSIILTWIRASLVSDQYS